MVLQEEQPKCSNDGNGEGKKKNRQNKIPQRGLGVAQLEKLRIEEQQRNNAPSSSNACQGMIPFPSQQPILPFLTATNDPNPVLSPVLNHDPLFRHPESISTPTKYFNATLPQLLENSVVGSGNAGHGFLSMLWNSMEPSPINEEVLAGSFGFCTPLNGDASIPGCQSSDLLQRRQRQQLPPISVLRRNELVSTLCCIHCSKYISEPCAVERVNKVLPPSSSGVSLQMEPPSNQSYTGNYNVYSSWPEERVVGMKRPWPFHLEGMPSHTPFPCKIPSFPSTYLKPNESMPDFIKSEPKRTYFRGGTSSSSMRGVEWKRFVDVNNNNEENGGGMDGGFRSLGPSSTLSIPKPKQPILTQAPSSVDYPEFSSVSCCQESMNDAISSSQPPFYSFLPMGPNSCEKTLNEQRREALDGVDLSLKL